MRKKWEKKLQSILMIVRKKRGNLRCNRSEPGVEQLNKKFLEKKCNKNVINFKKGVAICKSLCYNTVTYIREKE